VFLSTCGERNRPRRILRAFALPLHDHGRLLFAFMAGLYYWLPKMTGRMMNKKLGQWHFWTMFVFFNLTFFPMFIIGLLGQPVVSSPTRRTSRCSTTSRRLVRSSLDSRS